MIRMTLSITVGGQTVTVKLALVVDTGMIYLPNGKDKLFRPCSYNIRLIFFCW